MRRRGRPPHPDVLTPREWEVLSLLRENLTNEQIAQRLGITVRAARFHVSEILSKLNVASRDEAAAWEPSPEHRRWRLQTGFQVVSLLAALAVLTGLGVLAWTVVNRGGSSTETVALPTLPPPVAPGGPEWVALEQRPLNLPAMPSSGLCPVVPGRQVSPGLGIALGGGPVYPVLDADTAIDIGQFSAGGEWLGNKVLWVAPPGFTGKVLIRGGRLDGDGQVGFDNGSAFLVPLSELRLDTAAAAAPPSGEWYNWTTYTRMKEPGCYAYQVDGDGFSYTIVFRAELGPSSSPEDPYAALERRPLNLPQVSPGDCPVATLHEVRSDVAPALGPGPLYPVGFDDTSTMNVAIGGFPTQEGWLGAKTLWLGSADFRGRALVRGGRLDAPGQVGFGDGTTPDTELRLDATGIYADGVTWLNSPSYTRVQQAGCYAYQVDGDGFSYTIVFRAVPTTS